MENTEIASIFRNITHLMQIKGENAFRVRAYENASEVVSSLEHSLKELHSEGVDLKSIPGIGKNISDKIEEMLETGRCSKLEELLETYPAGLLEIIKLTGVGPKKAALFFKELGVSDLDALEAAASAGRIEGLPGMGKKTEEKILKSIIALRSVSGRQSLANPLRHAGEICAFLKSAKGVIECVPAGSARRWKDSPRDLDILAVTDSVKTGVPEIFVKYPHVKEVLSKGDTKVSVLLDDGLQVDLRILGKSDFGSALHHFTGSKAHNVAMRERAVKMGLKINEYGVFKVSDDTRVAGASEESVFKAVGLPWIAPEIRENRGEIEAAENGKLPEELQAEDIRGDLHMHTTASDGSSDILGMAEAAMERGYEYIAITDHSHATGIANGLDEARLMENIKAIDNVNRILSERGLKFRVLKGAECDILGDGTLDYSEAALRQLDCVVGAIHSGFNQPRDVMTARIVKALETGLINILAHPTGRLIGRRPPYEVDIEEVMAAAKRNKTFMELNCYPDRLDLKDSHLKLAKEMGILIAVSTDSHSPQGLSNIHYGIHTARRAWLEAKDVLNTRPLEEVLELFGK